MHSCPPSRVSFIILMMKELHFFLLSKWRRDSNIFQEWWYRVKSQHSGGSGVLGQPEIHGESLSPKQTPKRSRWLRQGCSWLCSPFIFLILWMMDSHSNFGEKNSLKKNEHLSRYIYVLNALIKAPIWGTSLINRKCSGEWILIRLEVNGWVSALLLCRVLAPGPDLMSQMPSHVTTIPRGHETHRVAELDFFFPSRLFYCVHAREYFWCLFSNVILCGWYWHISFLVSGI